MQRVPADFVIDTEHQAVFTLATGTLTVLDLLEHMARLQADPRFAPSMNQIVDFRRVAAQQVSSADIRSLAKRSVYDAGSRRALIIPESATLGAARQFAADRDEEGEHNIRVVHTLEKASQWTGIDLDVAKRAFAELVERVKRAGRAG
jgi:hypothetical protein